MLGGMAVLATALLVVSLTLDSIYFGGRVVDLEPRTPVAVVEVPPPPDQQQLRLAVATMFSPTHTFVHYVSLADLLGQAVGLDSALVVRPTYEGLRESMTPAEVDVALVCTGPYAIMALNDQVELLAQPELRPDLTYHSALIVPQDSPATSLADLRGGSIAYSDPESHTGCFVLRHELDKRGYKPNSYYSKVLYTGSHDRSIDAVAGGFVDGAPVHSLILDGMIRHQPELAGKLRVVWRSDSFGPPPVVVPKGLDPELKERLQQAFLVLHETAQGREILDELGIVRFVLPPPEAYDSVIRLYQQADELLFTSPPGP